MENKAHRKVHRRNGTLIATIVASVFVVAVVVGVVFVSRYEATTIADNVYVHNLSLGGMTADEAVIALENEFGTDYFDKSVVVSCNDKEYKVNLLDVVTLDAKETANEAVAMSNNLFGRLFNKNKNVIPFELEADEDKLERTLIGFVEQEETQAGLFVFNGDYTSVAVDVTKVDKILDSEKTAEIIIDNAENNIFDAVDAVFVSVKDEDFKDEMFGRLNRTAVDASVGMKEDGSTYIIPEQFGAKANEDLFEELFEKYNGVFKMDVMPIQPEITTAQLDIEFYQDVLGEYTSNYDVNLINRTKNVTLATTLVNGTIIMPGHRFSYNGVVGKRSYERGFVNATVYTGEGTEEGIGGGICQVSSTIYCAQLRADLKTVSRTNHSYTVVYVPLGQDATVVYGAIDYIFENDTNFPVKIVANASGGRLNVKILGTKADASVNVEVVSVTDSTVAFGEVQKEDPELPLGTTKVDQKGQIGVRASTYKIYYKNGVEQKREFVAKSNYKPMNRIVLMGTGPEAETEDGEGVENVEGEDIETLPTDAPLDGDEITEDLPLEGEITKPDGEETPEDKEPGAEQPPAEEEPTVDSDLSDSGL